MREREGEGAGEREGERGRAREREREREKDQPHHHSRDLPSTPAIHALRKGAPNHILIPLSIYDKCSVGPSI